MYVAINMWLAEHPSHYRFPMTGDPATGGHCVLENRHFHGLFAAAFPPVARCNTSRPFRPVPIQRPQQHGPTQPVHRLRPPESDDGSRQKYPLPMRHQNRFDNNPDQKPVPYSDFLSHSYIGRLRPKSEITPPFAPPSGPGPDERTTKPVALSDYLIEPCPTRY